MDEIKEDNNLYFEDALLTRNIMWVIESKHNLKVSKLYRHVKIDSYEVDALAITETPEHIERWIGFELKDNSIDKATLQAMLRRKYFDYFYVVINLSVSSIVKYLFYYPKPIKEYKIGYVSSYDNIVVITSNYIPREKKEENKEIVGKSVDKKQMDLIRFLQERKMVKEYEEYHDNNV